MAEDDVTEEEVKKPSKLPLIIGLVLALIGGGGGFYAVSSGMILGDASAETTAAKTDEKDGSEEKDSSFADIAYVEIPPVVVSLAPGSANKHLKFRAQLEVGKEYKEDMELITPRVTDVMHSYLRALETADLEAPSALMRIRAHLLRRIQIVSGPDRVRDLLIMEFVLN